MIKWHIKYALASLLGILPFRHYLHHKVQLVLGGSKLDEKEMLTRAVELYTLAFKNKRSLEDNIVLEIGTGWFPFMPIIAYLYGAKNIITIDINPWLRHETVRQTIKSILDNSEYLKNGIDSGYSNFDVKLSDLKNIYDKNDSLKETLEKLNINYIHSYDICNLSLDNEDKVDLVISSNVLEHIDQEKLGEIHKHLFEITKPNAIAVHRFNPGDHYSHLSGSSVSFLTISESLWRIYREGGIAYHNRLRTIEHAKVIIQANWSIHLWVDAIDNKAIKNIENGEIRLNAKYKNMSTQETCAFYSWMVLGKNNELHVSKPKTASWITDVL
jgi:2-polyprenyl-3-methyl-5-hydroxy-6-metoxy-1,4-benzoquinol methylase